MVKVRLWGTPEEVKALADYLESAPRVRVLTRSSGYADRGKSAYERVYMDVVLDESAAEIIKRLKGGQ